MFLLYTSSLCILADFIFAILLQETGHTLSLKEGPTVVYGTIAAVSADNPASSALGGFKEGSQAYRFCHQCYITLDKIALVVRKIQKFNANSQSTLLFDAGCIQFSW